MDISKEQRKMIVDEFNFILKNMEENDGPRLKNYYFSATYGLLNRIKRRDYDPQLLFMEFSMQFVHTQLENLITGYAAGITAPPPPPQDFMNPLQDMLKILTKRIKNNKDDEIYKILEAMICFVYSISGPGYYQAQQGIKIIPDFD